MPSRPPSQSAADALRLLVSARGGRPAGGESAIIEVARQRFNRRFQNFDSLDVKINVFLYGIEPLAHYLSKSFPATWTSTTTAAKGDMLFECFQVIAKRTKPKARFEPVTEHEDAWTRVEVGIVNIAAGVDVRVPRLENAQMMAVAGGPVRQQMLQPAWWSHWLFVTS